MAKDEDLTLDIIARGDNVTQRGLLENDWDHFAR